MEAGLLPCGVDKPIQEQIDVVVDQATLDRWQQVVTAGCPQRQGEFATAAQVWRDAQQVKTDKAAADKAAADAAAADKAAHRAELITAANAVIQAQAVVMTGYAVAPYSAAGEEAMRGFAMAAVPYGDLDTKYGAENPDVREAVKGMGPFFTTAAGDHNVTAAELLSYMRHADYTFTPVTGWVLTDHTEEMDAAWNVYKAAAG